MCSISINDGVVSVHSSGTLTTSKGIISSGSFTHAVNDNGETVEYWNIAKNGTALLASGNHAATGIGVTINVGEEDQDSALSFDGQDSSVTVIGRNAILSFSDETSGTYGLVQADNTAAAFLENSIYNTVCLVGENTFASTGPWSGGNFIAGYGTNNQAYLEGTYNMYASTGNSVINVGEYAYGTMLAGTNSGTDVVNDKGNMSFYYGGSGNVELNSMGYGLLANISQNKSAQVNYMGSYSAVFAGERYIDEDTGKIYNYTNYLDNYGWTQENISPIFEGTNNQEYFEAFFKDKLL